MLKNLANKIALFANSDSFAQEHCFMSIQRTIETILNLTTGEQIEVDELFADQHKRESEIFQLRTQIEKSIQLDTIEYVCIYCKQPVAIRGRLTADQKKNFYFTHPYNSQDCIIKTKSRLTEEQIRCIKYNGEKESVLHDTLKRLLGQYLMLTPEITEVRIDEVYKDRAISDKWRKPDVLSYHSKIGKIAFELQLSTTFLSVIVARTLFYQQQGIYLVWVFPNFSLQTDVQKFTQKDVFYNNYCNVYVFDKKAQQRSEEDGQLRLTCYYQEYFLHKDEVLFDWRETIIGLDDLHFKNKKDFYFHNSNAQKKKLEAELLKIKKERKEREDAERVQKKVDTIAEHLRKFYKNDRLYAIGEYDLRELIRYGFITNALNEHLKFANENAAFITRLFFERKKPNFLKFICSVEEIAIDTNLLHIDQRTVFEEVMSIQDESDFTNYMSCLFRRSYQPTDNDFKLLNELYNKNCNNRTDFERREMERWAVAKLYTQLTKPRAAFDLVKCYKLLLAIASLKYNLLIGYRYANMKQLVHYIFDMKKEHAVIFFKAVHCYGHYESLLAEDKSGKLRMRVRQLEDNYVEQDSRYDYLVFDLFPELVAPTI